MKFQKQNPFRRWIREISGYAWDNAVHDFIRDFPNEMITTLRELQDMGNHGRLEAEALMLIPGVLIKLCRAGHDKAVVGFIENASIATQQTILSSNTVPYEFKRPKNAERLSQLKQLWPSNEPGAHTEIMEKQRQNGASQVAHHFWPSRAGPKIYGKLPERTCDNV
jgi:hypothetical protein